MVYTGRFSTQITPVLWTASSNQARFEDKLRKNRLPSSPEACFEDMLAQNRCLSSPGPRFEDWGKEIRRSGPANDEGGWFAFAA